MTETIPQVNVQALRAFFSQHFESMKSNTQPRSKHQKNKGMGLSKLSRLSLTNSKQDLIGNKTSNTPSVSKSISVFDLTNDKQTISSYSKHQNTCTIKKSCGNKILSSSLSNIAIIPRNKLHTDDNLYQVLPLKTKNDIKCIDTLSNDSGVEIYESRCLGDCRLYNKDSKKEFQDVNKPPTLISKENNIQNAQKSPTVNIVIKPPLFKKCLQSQISNEKNRNIMTTVWNRTYEVDINQEIEKNLENNNSEKKIFYSEVVINNNYVCKAQYRQVNLPSLDIIGSPPPKPDKLPKTAFSSKLLQLKSQFIKKCNKPLKPNKPSRLPPPPPVDQQLQVDVITATKSFAQNLSCHNANAKMNSDINSQTSCWQRKNYDNYSENIYDDTLDGDLPSSPALSQEKFMSELSRSSFSDTTSEHLYQDTQIYEENLYEEVPFSENNESQSYNKSKKSGKVRDIYKLLQKENDKREKELDRGKRKFGLTGEEIPLEKGYVKSDTRGGHGDLAVKKGETVLILRMEDNPTGRWLVQNEKGKIGYVELDNITVNANSIKHVMKERRYSMGGKQSRRKSDSSEAIYEETC